MKLIWFNTKSDGKTRTYDFGCNWIFFLILATVVALVWLAML